MRINWEAKLEAKGRPKKTGPSETVAVATAEASGRRGEGRDAGSSTAEK